MLTIMTILVALAVGAVATIYVRRRPITTATGMTCEVTNIELAATGALVLLVAVLVTIVWGPAAAQARTAGGYHEFFNGSLISSTVETHACTRDGGQCSNKYRCDPHQVEDRHYDSKGRYTYSTYHTEYHHCPYATRESDYFLNDNLGRKLLIGADYLDADPREWRDGHGIPGDLPRGEPPRWTEAVSHLKTGIGDPVTMLHTYTNFILPTEGELYKQYSPSIDRYLKAGLLPKHTANLDGHVLLDYDMLAVKFQALKVSVDEGEWNARLMRLNAALGIGVQGDLHMVVVPASRVQNPDDYMNALVSYWQHRLGRWGFPKNGIAVVLGASADGKTIEWARAKTGMPEGNGEMIAAVSFDLEHKPLDAKTILGEANAHVSRGGKKVDYADDASPDGLLGKIMLSDHPFRRACMNCKDKGDHGTGYTYLKSSLPISGAAKVTMVLITLVVATVLWAIALFCDPVGYCTGRRRPRSNRLYY